jgi:hypothetical protein
MNAKQIEVHNYYKSLHPKALILYRVPGRYIVLGEDVIRASKSLSIICVLEPGVGSMPDKFFKVLTAVLLVKAGWAVLLTGLGLVL